jgi:cytochrome c-type biogenesis protein CcmH
VNRKRTRCLAWAFVALTICLALPVTAREAAPAAENPALEKRTMDLAEQLRCLVCQNQTIAESTAGLAVDLKNQIREQLSKGQNESQIIDYMVARYGDFVLYKPPFKTMTALLWLGPLILLLAGLGWLYRVLARRRKQAAPPELTRAEHERAKALLEGTESQ